MAGRAHLEVDSKRQQNIRSCSWTLGPPTRQRVKSYSLAQTLSDGRGTVGVGQQQPSSQTHPGKAPWDFSLALAGTWVWAMRRGQPLGRKQGVLGSWQDTHWLWASPQQSSRKSKPASPSHSAKTKKKTKKKKASIQNLGFAELCSFQGYGWACESQWSIHDT